MAVEDLMSIMDEAAQRRMAGCDGAASQTSREELEVVVRVHECAIAKAATVGGGSRGGETVGHAFRASLK